MADDTRRIKLTPYLPVRTQFNNRDCYRVRIVASDANLMDNEIFGYQRSPLDPEQGTTCDEFSFICSPYDLSVYPIGTPDSEQFPQYFRKDTFDIYVPGPDYADQLIADVQAQVCQLVTSLNRLDTLAAEMPIWCPAAPDDDSDESDSSS